MKKLFFTLNLLIISLFGLSQTLYVPSGTSGIGTSSTGNIGIGTDQPSQMLEVNGQGLFNGKSLIKKQGAGEAQNFLWFMDNSSNNQGYLGHYTTGQFRLATYEDQLDFVTNGSKVSLSISDGIGTFYGKSLIKKQGAGETQNFLWFMDNSSNNQGYLGHYTTGQFRLATYEDQLDFVTNGSKVSLSISDGIGTFYGKSLIKKQGAGETQNFLWFMDNSSNNQGYLGHYTTGQFRLTTYENRLDFVTNGNIINMTLLGNGNVGVGTTETGTHKLAVEGTIGAREIKVEADSWSDFVFDRDYKLRKLEEVENFIEKNNHLPEIPSEKEVLENGIQLGKMDAKLLQKIEELTLYMIEINKRVNSLETENSELKEKIKKMEAE